MYLMICQHVKFATSQTCHITFLLQIFGLLPLDLSFLLLLVCFTLPIILPFLTLKSSISLSKNN
jgi:hypothetical protein